jgi:hypothetical protein
MTPQRHQHIKRLFLAAVELAPSEVQPFLDQACGHDGDLRSEVQSLIDHHRTQTLLNAETSADTAGPLGTTLLSALEGELSLAFAESPSPPRPAGTMIAGRYRLVSPLGRGGMSVVYRAEDIELGQSIALKFLSLKLQENTASIDLLRREVRVARQITHPNVVRIFDLGTADGETFISMELVAGEDLASLVRRVGPLPAAKVLQIARQLAAGLAAAHEAGVLHRDLKPANVMIDGSGNVRILDFGIAAQLDDEQALARLSGTPGFLAPELLAGQKPTPQSDLFAWGLVVYYAAAGKMPTAEQLSADPHSPDLPWLPGTNDDLATCVQSCLQSDPQHRPDSARNLLATLGDPLDDLLDNALQAGRMPRPELVAAATSWRPSVPLLNGLLAAGLVLLLAILLLADRTLFLPRSGLVKSPEALQDIAQQTLIELGHQAPISPVLTGVALDTDCLRYVRGHPQLSKPWQKIAAGELPAVSFWYRQGDPRLPQPDLLSTSDDQSRQLPPDSAEVRLDGRGKLLSLQVASDEAGDSSTGNRITWPHLFELAGLPYSEFREIQAKRLPPLFADAVQAWEGPFTLNMKQPVAVTAASLRGRIVYFDVAHPWAVQRQASPELQVRSQPSRYAAVRTAIWLVAIGVAAVLAWRHASQGHADWRGAWRVTACVLILGGLDWLCGSRHNFLAVQEITTGFQWLSAIVFCGATAGVAYLAVEPAARRWWPWSIITMRRLLDGRFQDRAIWADVLLGVVAGLLSVCLRQLCTLTNQLFSVPVSGLNDFDPGQNLLDHFGLRYKVAVIVSALLLAVIDSLLVLTLVVALKRVLKSTAASAVLIVILLTALSILSRGLISPIDWLARGFLLSIATWLLLRYGLLATIIALATFYSLNNAPLTLEHSRWYAPAGFLILTSAATLLILSWRLARGWPR